MNFANRRFAVFIKLALCGASIAAIAMAVMVFGPTGKVEDSKADVIDLSFGTPPRSKLYVDCLSRMGLPKPEVFNLNGNTVYFTSGFVDGSPRQLLDKYQRTLNEQGFNEKKYHAPDATNQGTLMLGALMGDVVPLSVTDDHVIMGGATLKSKPRSLDELRKLQAMPKPKTSKQWAHLFNGHRWIEIVKDSDYDNRSFVLSTWSDHFDLEKMKPGNKEPDQDVDTTVPACPGCTRLLSFSKVGGSKLHRQTTYVSTQSADGAIRYYLDAMQRRGWELTDASKMYQKLKLHMDFAGDDAQMIELTKNDQFLTILAYRSKDGGTSVHVVRSD